jgi:hypothetical protein
MVRLVVGEKEKKNSVLKKNLGLEEKNMIRKKQKKKK